jgi:group I intron endonuclease
MNIQDILLAIAAGEDISEEVAHVDENAPGVYVIYTPGGIYVGSTGRSLEKRWGEHVRDLRKSEHRCPKLQRQYDVDDQSLTFWAVANCAPHDAVPLEQMKLDAALLAHITLLNVCLVAGSCLGVKRSPEAIAKLSAAKKGKKLSPEHIAKISAANKGRKWKPSPEHIAKLSAANKGRKPSPEHIAKLSAANKGKKHSPEHIAKVSAANKGRKHSPEAIAKMSAAKKGKKLSPEHIAKMSAALKGRELPPEHIAKMSAAQKARWRLDDGLDDRLLELLDQGFMVTPPGVHEGRRHAA